LGETVLGLPLHTIAPMFLAHNQGPSPQKKADVSNIPDLFKTGDSDAKNPIVARSVPAPAAVLAEPEAPAPVVESVEEQIETGGECVSISLSLLAANWPATLVKDIDPKFLAKAKVEIPVSALEAGLRGGKVDFGWKQLCRWMKPSPADELVAAHEQTRIGLPLSVVAPLFLQRKPVAPKQAHDPAGDIPPVFYQAGTAPVLAETTEELSEPATEPKVESSPSPVVEPESGPRKRVQDLAELFGQPEKRNWTPNEIVQRTSVLPGVSGALIALQDGLLVASCMPPEWRTETVAAFLPQIFGRMNQYTKELKMGELQSVTFTVEKGALQIFAAGIIYFATLSKPEQALPIYELSLIARELSRHTK
jgi:predicted regulator of Ras-like GTPase activity (Roadblock/LC7/MglB family)